MSYEVIRGGLIFAKLYCSNAVHPIARVSVHPDPSATIESLLPYGWRIVRRGVNPDGSPYYELLCTECIKGMK